MGKKFVYAEKYFSKEDVAKLFGYSSGESFRNSSAHERIMLGVDGVVRCIEDEIVRVFGSITYKNKKDMKVQQKVIIFVVDSRTIYKPTLI